jgi:quercetin dioxygenase-like cupin family protein
MKAYPLYDSFESDVDLTTPFGIKIRFLPPDLGAERGEIIILPYTDGPPLHTHERQREKFTVHQGVLQINMSGTWRGVRAGEDFSIPIGVPHTYRNNSSDLCLFEYSLTPGSRFSEMMRLFERLARQRKLTSVKDIRSIFYLAMVFAEFRDDVRSTQPPAFVMLAIARLARLIGMSIS